MAATTIFIVPVPSVAGIGVAREFTEFLLQSSRDDAQTLQKHLAIFLPEPLEGYRSGVADAVQQWGIPVCHDITQVRRSALRIMSMLDFDYTNGSFTKAQMGFDIEQHQTGPWADVRKSIDGIQFLLRSDDSLAARTMLGLYDAERGYRLGKPDWWIDKLWNERLAQVLSGLETNDPGEADASRQKLDALVYPKAAASLDSSAL